MELTNDYCIKHENEEALKLSMEVQRSCKVEENQKEAALKRVLAWRKCLKDDNFPCKIEEGLFLGSASAAANKAELKRLNITYILTVTRSVAPAYPNDFVYKVFKVRDSEDTNLRQYFDECISFIDEAIEKGGGVLVHCFVGKSRSVTIVVAYLMKKLGRSFSEALKHVRNRRPQAAPNPGFISQLKDFEKSLQGVASEQREEDGVCILNAT